MIGFKKSVRKNIQIPLESGDSIYVDRSGSGKRNIDDIWQYSLLLINEDIDELVNGKANVKIFAKSKSFDKDQLIIIEPFKNEYTVIGKDFLHKYPIKGIYALKSAQEMFNLKDGIPFKNKTVIETEFLAVEKGDTLYKESKIYKIVDVAPDRTLFLIDEKGNASMLNPRDGSALKAFGLVND